MEDMVAHLLPCHLNWTRDGQALIILHRVNMARYRADYILGTDRRMLPIFKVRSPRHNTDHYLFLGCIRGATQR